MPATRDGKTWRSQFYYEDWQGVRHKKNKRGFKTKAEAEEWERNFRQQQRKDLDINFENFVEIYFADMENRLRECKSQYKNVVLVENKVVGKPTFLFSTFLLIIFGHILHLILQSIRWPVDIYN